MKEGRRGMAGANPRTIPIAHHHQQEFSARGVTVNAVCPGFIESDMTEKLDLEV